MKAASGKRHRGIEILFSGVYESDIRSPSRQAARDEVTENAFFSENPMAFFDDTRSE
jgi:hypothetical protein